MLSRLKSILPEESLMTIYNSIILPTIDYAIPVWGWSSQSKENHKLEIFTPNLSKISIPSSKQGTASMCLIRTPVP